MKKSGITHKSNIDFTEGSLVRSLFLFALPIMLSEMLQGLYNSVDTLIVGNFLGKEALASVSVCSTLTWLFVSFSTGMSVGTGVVISRAYGGGSEEELNRVAGAAGSFSVVLGLVLSVAGVLAVPLLLRLVAVPDEIWHNAALYLRIYLSGLVFTIIYNIFAGILRSVGDSRTPLFILVATAVFNLFLDFILVYWIPLGVAGVAIATALSQLLSVLLALRKIRRTLSSFRISLQELPTHRKTVLEMLRIGMPSGLQNSIISFSNIFVWRYVTSFGTSVIAGAGVAQKINKFVDYPAKGFGMAMTTLSGQNAGAGKKERIRKGTRDALLLCGAIILALSLVLYLLASPATRLFSDQDDVRAIAVQMLHTQAPFYVFMLIREVLGGALRGCGVSRPVMLLALVGMIGVRQAFLAIALSISHVPEMVFIGYPTAWGATALIFTVYYFIRRKELFFD